MVAHSLRSAGGRAIACCSSVYAGFTKISISSPLSTIATGPSSCSMAGSDDACTAPTIRNRIATICAIITPGGRQEYCMAHPKFVVAVVGAAVALGSAAPIAQAPLAQPPTVQPRDHASELRRASDGHPDLQGVWDFRS